MTFMRFLAAVVLLAFVSAVVSAQGHTEILDVQPVPEASAATRQLKQSSSAGGSYGQSSVLAGSYGSVLSGAYGTGRHLLQAGSYGATAAGTYGLSAVQGGYSGRRLIEHNAEVQPPGPLLEYAQQQQDLEDADQAVGALAAAVARLRQGRAASSSSSRQLVFPAGTCYCRYDTAFSTWALAEDSCRQALYQRCQADSGLPCSWLDSFYSYAPVSGAGYSMPHEADIKAFLFQDCTPHPPCACAGITFDGTDPVSEGVACCRDLRVACKTPYSGLHCSNVEAFCADDSYTPALAAWSRLALQGAGCSSYTGIPYRLADMQELQAAAAAAAAGSAAATQPAEEQQAAFESALLAEAMRNMGQQATYGFADSSSGQHQRSLIIVLAAVAAGAVCVAVTAVVLSVRHEEAAAARPITSPMQSHLSVGDVYPPLVMGSRLFPPTPAACVGSKYLPPRPPLRQEGAGGSCLSRVIPAGRLGRQGSSITEPLLAHGLDRSLSNRSESSTGSTAGNNMP